MTGIPASASALCVPPVERSSTPAAASRLANGTRPVLSETERSARRTMWENPPERTGPFRPRAAGFQAGRRGPHTPLRGSAVAPGVHEDRIDRRSTADDVALRHDEVDQ